MWNINRCSSDKRIGDGPTFPPSMRVNDACRFTGISRSTLYLLIASGDIEIIKLGASTLVVTESLRRFINEKRRCAS